MHRSPFHRLPAPFASRLAVAVLVVPALCVSALCVSACAPRASQRSASEPRAAAMRSVPLVLQGVKDVPVAEARDLSTLAVPVLDVREPHEFAAGHVPGARNLPLGQLDAWAEGLDPEGAYVVICRSGKRSAKAVAELEAKGFKHLRNVTGGMLSWEREGFPVAK